MSTPKIEWHGQFGHTGKGHLYRIRRTGEGYTVQHLHGGGKLNRAGGHVGRGVTEDEARSLAESHHAEQMSKK